MFFCSGGVSCWHIDEAKEPTRSCFESFQGAQTSQDPLPWHEQASASMIVGAQVLQCEVPSNSLSDPKPATWILLT